MKLIELEDRNNLAVYCPFCGKLHFDNLRKSEGLGSRVAQKSPNARNSASANTCSFAEEPTV